MFERERDQAEKERLLTQTTGQARGGPVLGTLGTLGEAATREPKHIAIDSAISDLARWVDKLEGFKASMCQPSPEVPHDNLKDCEPSPPSLDELLAAAPDMIRNQAARIENLIIQMDTILF